MKRKKANTGKDGLPRWKGVREVRKISYENMALRLVWVPCGKGNCGTCPHGPYWYLVTWRGRKPSQWPIGRHLFRMKVKAKPDREILIVRILVESGERVDAYNYEYEPRGLDVKKHTSLDGKESCGCRVCESLGRE